MTIGFGILGAGMISSLHADALRSSRKARLVAICDVQPERASRLARDFAPDAKVYPALDALLADAAVDVVDVVTPNALHTDAVLSAARAGKHVLCEKPPAMSLCDTDRMIEACRRAGRKFGVFVQCRLREPIRHMRHAISQGRFGRLLRADAVMKWHRTTDYYLTDAWRSQRQSGAGVTIQHAFHYIDLLQYLAGPVELVQARMTNLGHPQIQIEDTLDATVQFRNGAIGSVSASTALWPGADARIELFGEKGAAVMQGAALATWRFQEERPEDEAIRRCGDPTQPAAASSPTALPSIDHQRVIDDCAEAIENNREVAIPCQTVRPTLEISLAMYKSARLGEPVRLPLGDDERIWE
jgi:UDP-N-acetyl-2-amino-2-deoxyglucuronate dehydrogenase